MKKLIQIFTAAMLLQLLNSCVSSERMAQVEKRMYLGVSRSGYLTANDALFTGPKEWLFDIKNIKIYKPSFYVPDDIVLVLENQIHNFRPTNGVMVYRQNQKTRYWAKVFFVPLVYCIENIICGEQDIIKIFLVREGRSSTTLTFWWREEKPNMVARWVQG